MFVFFRRLRFVYKKLRLQRLHYALPFLVLCLYTVVGAYVFRYFELEQDEQRRARYRQNTEYAFKRTLNRMLEVRCQDGLDAADQTLQTRHVKEHLFWLMDYLNLTQVIEERSENSPWTWMGAMSYAGQLYTTIGYGLPATQTFEGRLASIVYIMIGIPLFLIILAKAGKLLSRGLRKLYKRMHKMKRFPEAARRMSEPMKAIYHLTYAMASTALGPTAAPLVNGGHPPALAAIKEAEEARTRKIEAENKFRKQQQQQQRLNLPGMANKADEPRERKSFPIPWALAILIVWIMFSAALFCIWETEWGYMNSIYFYFVSISTVGLGDLVPTKRDMMIVNFFMILIGLALLSMCVNLIQEALEKLIEHIINQYIDEIEKIAAVVTNTETNEFNEFAEELEPFEVGMTEMLTVPVTTLGGGEHKVQGIGSSVKDWIAERASNMLLNKIYPEQSDSSSSSSSSEGEEEEEEADSEAEALQELEEVVVIDREPVMLHGAARVTVHRPSLVQLIEKRRIEALGQLAAHNLLPQISIHEGTPPGPVQLEEARRHRSAMPAGADGRKVSINERQSLASTPGREGSGRRKKAKKPPKVPKNYAGALLKYSAPTMQAIQAIEYAKLRTGRSNDFKSRLFAKFATNQRFAQIVECNAPAPPKHMVSSSIQTSPVQSPLPARRKSWRLRKMGCAVESIDSTSSELNVTTTRTNASCSANDIDSLYSNTYFDMCFGNYNSDSVPCLMAQPNTPQQQPQPGHRPTEEQPSLAVRRKFSEKLFGLFGRIRPARQNSSAERQGEVDGMEAAAGGKDGSGQHLSNSSRRRPHPFLCHSTPVSPATNRRYLANDSTTQPSIPTTPLIHLTDTVDAADQMRLSLTPSPSPAEALLDPAQRQDPDWAKARQNHSQPNARPANSPIGLVPLHHRSLSGRRRFSASTARLHPCAQRHNQLNEQATRSSSLTTLQRRQQLPPRPATAAAAEHQQQQQPSAVDNTQQQLTNLRNGPVAEKLLISSSNSSAALLRSSFSAEAAAVEGEKESTQPGVGLLEEAGTK